MLKAVDSYTIKKQPENMYHHIIYKCTPVPQNIISFVSLLYHSESIHILLCLLLEDSYMHLPPFLEKPTFTLLLINVLPPHHWQQQCSGYFPPSPNSLAAPQHQFVSVSSA